MLTKSLLTGLTLLITTVATAKPADAAATSEPKLAVLGHVDGESDNDLSLVTARFQDKLTFTNLQLEDQSTYLQLTLPGTIVPDSGQFIDVKSPVVKKIAVFQVTPKEGAIRIFVDKEAKLVKQAATAEVLGDWIVVTIDHNALNKISKAAAVTAGDAAAVAPAPAEAVKEGETAALGIGSSAVDLSGRLTAVSIFSAIMLLALLFFSVGKKYLRRRLGAADVADPISVRTLGTYPLFAKQKLALVEVCNEKILLAVSPDQVSFIKTIGGSSQRPTAQTAQTSQTWIAANSGSLDLNPFPAVDGPSLQNKNAIPANVPARATLQRNMPAQPKPQPSQRPIRKPSPPQSSGPAAQPGPVPSMPPTKGNRINVAIGDDGIKDHLRGDDDEGPKTIGDVTKLIREKLKTLSSI